ncbi:hypothetical protein [Cohnella sp. WQ 127256]|uniref:hypothetical protein n=1 Tax=Cohnella sp. WQ 127256 TaxID=2938790 RepID=UPI00211845C1|nr:hypothetical protein [Cohnella sp. WQ 127256]
MEKQKDYSRIVMFIYILAILITLSVVFLMGLPFSQPSHTWISFGALMLAETAIYVLMTQYLSGGKKSRALIPGYLAFVAIAGLYLAVVIVIIIAMSLIYGATTFSYGLTHFIALALAGIMASLVTIYFRHAEQQDNDHSVTSLQWVPDMRGTLLSIKHDLEGWTNESSGGLTKGILELDEKVRYSDPSSHPTLTVTEENLLHEVRQLSSEISKLVSSPDANVDNQRLLRQIREISNLVTSRNQQLIQLKA